MLEDFTAATAGLRAAPVLSPTGPLISVLILTLDGRELLDRLFRSFEAVNEYQAVEFIVVDHGSLDGTLECLRQWALRLPVKIIARGANFSFSESNNKAARLASGELLMLLNNDVVFVRDCLGEMVAALRHTGAGAVGLKQYQGLPESFEPRRIYHLGVRFGWNIVERRLRPHHVRPSAIDAKLMDGLAAFPAVTASALLCRRDDYLAVGGLCEQYVYGLEDVDFCCKLRFTLGKEVVSYNGSFAFHPKNATRNRDPSTRRPLEKRNRKVLQERWGYRVRRDFISSRFDDDGSRTGRPFTVGLAVPPDAVPGHAGLAKALLNLGEGLRRTFGWKTVYLGADDSTDASDLDLYVSTEPGFDVRGLTGAEPHLLIACYVLDQGQAWLRRKPLDAFDLRFCGDAGLQAQLLEQCGQCCRVDPQAPAPAVHDEIARALGAFRVALKIGSRRGELSRARALRRALVELGQVARIDGAEDWYAPPSLADDAAVVMDSSYRPAVDQINVLIRAASKKSEPGLGAWDGVIAPRRLTDINDPGPSPSPNGGGEIDGLAAAVLAVIKAAHSRRTIGPDDEALVDPQCVSAAEGKSP